MPHHPPHARFRNPAAHGFTMIEMMVVVLVIGIVAATVMPNLSGSADSVRLESATRGVGDLLDFCYHAAATTGRVHALTYDPATRHFDVVSEPPPVAADATAGASPDAAATGAATPDAATNGTPAGGGGAEGEASLTPVAVPGHLNRTLPRGITLNTMETNAGDSLSADMTGSGASDAAAAESEATGGGADATGAAFRLLFFPDGTTEFAKLELSTSDGTRRQIWIHGLSGTVTTVDPDAEGEVDLSGMIVDEDSQK